jgi:LuxR family maltose regulon positive regulatory protein
MDNRIVKSQVPRVALMKLLDSYSEKRVIYIHAPAGFGKTVSSLLWLEHREATANAKRASISLDVYDDKMAEFCKRYIKALADLQPENTALRELSARPAIDTAPVEFLLHTLGVFLKTNEKYVIVLDDLHVITNDEILHLLPILLKRMPGDFTVLLLSRAAPPDSFSEIIAKGELAIINSEHLQFDKNEIKTLFEQNGKPITSKQADEILTSTGGWAIGIRTFMLSEGELYKTQLTSRYLENFLKAHVWAKWDAGYKKFMMLSSVVEELTPELCEHLTDMPGGQMLDALMHENAFLRTVGNKTFKFHDLFRSFLLDMLKQQGQLTNQYKKAGKYYFDKKDYFRAVQYYQKAQDDDGVAKSIFQMYDYNSLYASVEDTLRSIRLSLNERIIKKHPFLLEPQIWAAYVEGNGEEFTTLLDRYYKLLPKIILKTPRSVITYTLLRCIDFRENFVNILSKLRMLPFKGSIKAFTPSITQGIPYFHRSCRDFSDLAEDMEKNLALAEKTIGLIIGEEFSVIKHCIIAGLLYEKGRIDEAREHALIANANCKPAFSIEIRFCAMSIHAATLFGSGEMKKGTAIFEKTGELIKKENAFHLNMNLRAFQVFAKLLNSDREEAKKWLSLYGESTQNYLPLYKMPQHYTTARAYIVMGDYDMAILFLKRILTFAESYHRPLDIIEANILLSVAYWQKGRGGLNIALAYLEKAVCVAYKYRYTQQFSIEGSELMTMLQRLQKRAHQNKDPDKVPADFIKTLYIASVAGSKRSKGLTGGRISKNLRFTPRQKEVMRLMCEGQNRNEIGIKIGITPYSVKSHMELIYNKLNVANNIDAILKIRELGLLAEPSQ